MFARKPKTIEAVLIALADSLEHHAKELRRLAGQPGVPIATAPSDDDLDNKTIDLAHIEADYQRPEPAPRWARK